MLSYGPALIKMKVFCLFVMVADWNMFSITVSLISKVSHTIFGGNLLRNSLGILHMYDALWYEQYSINNLNLIIYVHKFWFQNIFISERLDCYNMSHHTLGGGDRNRKIYIYIYIYKYIKCILIIKGYMIFDWYQRAWLSK